MDEIKIVDYSLIALLLLTFTAFIYTCHLVYGNNGFSEQNIKVSAGFKA